MSICSLRISWNLVESSSHAALLPEKQLLRSPNSSLRKVAVNKSAVVRSKSYNVPMLTPVVEYDADAGAGGGASCVRRHSVSEMTSCLEESGAAVESGTSAAETGSTSCLVQQFSGSTASGGHAGGRKRLFWGCTHLITWLKPVYKSVLNMF